MRKEMIKYAEQHPQKRNFLYYINRLAEKLQINWFKYQVAKAPLGSPEWHALQHKLSLCSSIGLDMWKRSYFYQNTLNHCGDFLTVHPGVSISYPNNVKFGSYVFINKGTIFTAHAEIIVGNNVLIGPYVIFNSASHIYQDPNQLIREQGHVLGSIIVDDDVWIGAHSCIFHNVHIGMGAIVAANSVVKSSIPPYSIVAGSPAKIVKLRKDADLP
jgi:acetyltransferase-like isoleucine patch superfamily enzyme